MDFTVTERQRLLQETAREFGQNEVVPLAKELDKNQDPAKAVFPLSLYKRADKLGFTKMLLPEQYGGGGFNVLDYIIVMEEFAAADVGFAIAINGICTNYLPVLEYGSEDQRKTCLENIISGDMVLLSIAGSERDVPSSEDRLAHLFPDPKYGNKTFAKPDRNGYIINGTKDALITLPELTKYYLIIARTDMTKPAFESISMFFVPADTPGLSVGKPTKIQIGGKGTQIIDLHLDNCRVPKEALIGEEGKAHECLSPIFLVGITTIGTVAVGLARTVYEYALDHAKKRLVGGEPLIKYQAVAMTLVDMKMKLDAARLLVWRAACSENFQYSALAKVYATEMAVSVAQKAFDILGRNSILAASPVEKYLRDAVAMNLTGGATTIWRLIIGETL